MSEQFDIAVVGSGFSGSLMAMIARQLRCSVLLIEKGAHPRFAIGESTTPLTNLMLEQVADEFELPFLKDLSKWGTWQQRNADIGCGLKRGFTFLQHELGSPFTFRPDRSNELLVAASPNDRIADTHWYRPDFDHHLQRKAVELGVTYLERCDVNAVTWDRDRTNGSLSPPGPATLSLFHDGVHRDVRVKLIIDASGPRGCLWQLLELDEMPLAHLPDTQAVFSHFRDVDCLPWPANNTPYPPESAAVHHVFDGGWIWVLRFSNGITSAGAVARRERAEHWNFRAGEAGWHTLLEELPAVRGLFTNARPVEPFRLLQNVSFRSLTLSGPGWVLLPSAAGFVDPLLSTGFPLALRGVLRIGRVLRAGSSDRSLARGLSEHATTTVLELDLAARLIAALYWNMNDFALFRALTKLYFAAASFAETRQRLAHDDVGGFLLREHPTFGPAMRRCLDTAIEHGQTVGSAEASAALQADIRDVIEPIDLIGISRSDRNAWFPAENADLFHNRHKLGASHGEIEELNRRCGL